ncbi:hypothetical protein OEA41_004695 [Lepraria neglecta]|uniref:C2H2-type domain-containing protein n=1 Tax=Lepraria neglecta TaxID=209136 RepID=A0AAE0DG36_9LECA|nr:hypothetical protein OEA41_004695 [Lepraria neglecta]
MSNMNGMDGSEFNNEWSEFFDFNAFDAFGDGMGGIDMQGDLQGGVVAEECLSKNTCKEISGVPSVVYNNIDWVPLTAIDLPISQYHQDPDQTYPSDFPTVPHHRFSVYQTSQGCTSELVKDPFRSGHANGTDDMGGASSDSVEHSEPWQASADQTLLSTPAELLLPKPQGENIDVANIDDLFGLAPAKGCVCLGCLYWPTYRKTPELSRSVNVSCRIPDCSWTYHIKDLTLPECYLKWYVVRHEEKHFFERTPGRDAFTCKHEHCIYTTKRSSDIKRHYAAKHCKNAKKFPCTVIGCKFSGDNGFPRKDKMRDHLKAGHRNMFTPGKPVQNIKSKAGISKSSGTIG